MKKTLLIIFLLFVPLIVNAEDCDTDKVTIESIEKEEVVNNAVELTEATSDGKSINLNIGMSYVGDKITYKLTIKNDSNEDYELDQNSFNINSNYIDYKLNTNDNNYIVGANSTKTVYLTVNYKSEVPNEAFNNGSFTDNKTLNVDLFSNNINNPNTGINIYVFSTIFIILVCIYLYYVLKRRKYAKLMIFILALSIIPISIIPISINALCKCNVVIKTNVEIHKCRYKLITSRGSFSKTEDVKEICVNNMYNDESYTIKRYGYEGSLKDAAFVIVGQKDIFKDDSYIKIYEYENDQYPEETKVLVKTITKDMLIDHKYSLFGGKVTDSVGDVFIVNAKYYKYELSDDLKAFNEVEVITILPFSSNGFYEEEVLVSPWIKDQETIDKIEVLSESAYDEGYGLNGFSCSPDVKTQDNCTNTFYAIFEEIQNSQNKKV